jgi:hypothetical protein
MSDRAERCPNIEAPHASWYPSMVPMGWRSHFVSCNQHSAALLTVCVLSAPFWLGCLFDLGDVRADAKSNAAPDAGVEASPPWDASVQDANADSDVGALDGCWPASAVELCALAALACGPLETVDNCAQPRVIAACGDCGTTAHCETGACISYVFAWKSSSWSPCSQPCGGGTQSRDVWCERDDGVHVADTACAGAKPATSEACNQDACCSPYCVPHDACGSDGCVGDCGTCVADRSCRNGYCVWEHGNDGSQTCSTICAWGSSTCVDTSTVDCGTKADTTCYCW